MSSVLKIIITLADKSNLTQEEVVNMVVLFLKYFILACKTFSNQRRSFLITKYKTERE